MLKLPLATLAFLFAATTASAQSHMYKCTDSKGKPYYTDRPPAECTGKELDELSKQGMVVKKREAALTPEQLAAREAEEKRKKEAADAAREVKRKNDALLNTYASVKDIEDGRQRALKQSLQAAKDIQKRIDDARKLAAKLASDKEFYVNKPIPKKLSDDIKDNEIDLASQQGALAAKKKELSEINAKYDEDKRRYLELTGAKPTAGAPAKD